MKRIISVFLTLALVLSSFSFAFADTTYTVKSGDVLWKIGKTFGVTYQSIAAKNALQNANFIRVGQKLIIPTTSVATKPATPKPVTGIKGTTLTIATTTSTNDTGLLDVLVPAFDLKYGTKTKWLSVGSGEAMEIGKRGDADVLLVHSPAAEKQFIADGFGINRKDVMYNFYYIVGPKADPAKVSGKTAAVDAFKAIYAADATFLSRADKSGTNTKELAIWKTAGLAPTGATDKWYKEAGVGMLDLLNMANEVKGYTLVDSGTWGANKGKLTNLDVMVKGDPILFNPYGVIQVNPAKYPNVHSKAALAFSNFITSAEGQKIIGNFTSKAGQKLFIPDAK